MSQSTVTEFEDYSLIDLHISKPGKLGIEFRQTSSPYFVVKVADEAQELYSVRAGDLLVGIRSSPDREWTETDDLPWSGLIDVLKDRPAYARFKRFETPSSRKSEIVPELPVVAPPPTGPAPSVTPLLESESHMVPIVVPAVRKTSSDIFPQPIMRDPSPPRQPRPVSPLPRSTSPPSESKTVMYTSEGSLGLEFEETDFPFRVSSIVPGSMSSDKGISKGDCLVSVNGRGTVGMNWAELRKELMKRPTVAVFDRSSKDKGIGVPSGGAPSVWGLAAGLLKQAATDGDIDQERAELKRLIDQFHGEDLEGLKQRSLKLDMVMRQLEEVRGEVDTARAVARLVESEVQELRTKNANLLEIIQEMESSHSAVIMRFESELTEKSKQMATLNSQLSEEIQKSKSHPIMDSAAMEMLNSTISAQETRIELLEKDNARLRKENSDLGTMVQQCLEKIQKDLADKPHWVDRRVVCAAIGVLLKETSDIRASPEMHAVARQRLGDVLGLTVEERTGMGLLTVPIAPKSALSFGENFVSFLEHEIQPDSDDGK